MTKFTLVFSQLVHFYKAVKFPRLGIVLWAAVFLNTLLQVVPSTVLPVSSRWREFRQAYRALVSDNALVQWCLLMHLHSMSVHLPYGARVCT